MYTNRILEMNEYKVLTIVKAHSMDEAIKIVNGRVTDCTLIEETDYKIGF